jgi:gamma-glutamyltranspeptidase/glutathione hydrolase
VKAAAALLAGATAGAAPPVRHARSQRELRASAPLHRRALAALAAIALGGCAAVAPLPPPQAASGLAAERTASSAQHFMAAAAHPLAAQAGRQILAAGGSALDAAVAMQMVLTLVEPQSSGIGGGAFLLHWDGRRVQSYDGRETAPMAVDEHLFVTAEGRAMDFSAAAVGGRAVGVPGLVRMLELAHRQHGRLPWPQLFTPAIELAEQGFAISPRLHALVAADRHLPHSPAARAYFYTADGQAKPVGTLLRNPQLAATLRAIADTGADALHRGPIAADIVAAVRGHPTNAGALGEADLAAYRAVERPALCTDYRRWRVCGMGPPSSGGIAVAQILGIVAAHELAAWPPARTEGGLEAHPHAVHLFSEAGRLAFADRAQYVADPDFVPVDAAALTNPDYLAARARLIGSRSIGRAVPGAPAGADRSGLAPDDSAHRIATSHLAAVDRFGHAVSMTSSIEDAFGSRLMVRGFLLNNQLTDFSFLPRAADATGRVQPDGAVVANRVQAGKRPRSSMAPTLVFDRDSGRLLAALGSPGGSQIINYVARTLIAILDWRLDPQQAIALPHFGSRNGPTELEQGASADLIAALRSRGHEVRLLPMTSGLQAIVRTFDPQQPTWIGGADPRREGVAVGE